MYWRKGRALDKTEERVVFGVCKADTFIGCVDNVKRTSIRKGERLTKV